MVLIYTHHITSRLTYAFELVFTYVLKIEYKITTDLDYYNLSSDNKFSYTFEDSLIENNMACHQLLFEKNIENKSIGSNLMYNQLPVFFESNKHSPFPFDVFATTFYFATRYEEYTSNEIDKHSRFLAEKSLFYKYGVLQMPYLNVIIEEFAAILKLKFNSLVFTKPTFKALSTIDIDNAYAYAHKGLARNMGGAFNDLIKFKINKLTTRLISCMNDNKDPYNTFKLISDLHLQSQVALHYFVLIGDYSSYDKNPSFKNSSFKKLLKNLSNNHEMGLHPSYYSFNQLENIVKEKNRLENIIEKKITSTRCHFLRVNLPETYRAFIECGITDDYTMLYPSQTGFRTGLCIPHPWFDLKKNEATSLRIHPSIVMEGTLRDYNKCSPEEANSMIKNYIHTTQKFGGEFISIWHNDSFSEENKNWTDVYKTMLNELKINL